MGAKLAAWRAVAGMVRRLPATGKLARSLAGREGAAARWAAWSRSRPSGMVVWVHAASVGEALTAAPVARRFRVARPGTTVVLSHTSPSLSTWPGPAAFHHKDFAPAEDPAAVSAAFDAVAPSLLVFSRADLWPEMIAAAGRRGIPVAVIGGQVRAASARLAWPVRQLARSLHESIRYLGAATAGDADRWMRLGVPSPAISVTGDPRHDQVLEQVTRTGALRDVLAWSTGRNVLVAGSAEEEDESVVLDGFAASLASRPDARLLFVPHAPDADTVSRVGAAVTKRGLSVAFWPGTAGLTANVVIVTSTGLLSDLYVAGTAAYVGGGFRRRDLHAVVEPAALGLPVMVGPETAGMTDLERLLAAGGGVVLPRQHAAGALARQWLAWLGNDNARARAGLAARATINQGAAEASSRALLRLAG